MFNYFFTVEFNLEVSRALQLYFGPMFSFSKTHFNVLEASSKTFFSEQECADTVVTECDALKEKLVGLDKKLTIEDVYVEAVANPKLNNASRWDQLSDEEKSFWSDNKLAVFAIYEDDQAEDFLARFTIYAFEDSMILESSNPAFYQQNFSTTIN